MRKLLPTSVVAGLCAFSCTPSAQAQTTWVSSSSSCNNGTYNWTTTACWSPATVPTSGTVNVFNTGSTAITVNDNESSLSIGALEVDATGSGSMTLTQTGNSFSAVFEYIGYNGAGTFNQSGGSNTVNGGNVLLGVNSASSGTYILSGGTVTSAQFFDGSNGSGTVTQSGGTNTANQLFVSAGPRTATYTLSGTGSVSIPAAVGGGSNGEFIGEVGSGTFNQSGGTNTDDAVMVLGYGGASGTYTLSGGSLTVTGGITTYGTAATLNLNGGSLSVTGGIYVDNLNLGSNGYYFNGTGQQVTAAAEMTNNGTFYNAGALTVTGTLTNGGTLGLEGGTLTGSGTWSNNAGSITGYGTISGTETFNNYGLVSQSGGSLTFANTGTNNNYGNWNLSAGNQLQLTGSTLVNAGALNLNSGFVTGTGTLTNAAGGTITGPGAISTAFSNAGVLAVTGGATSVTNAFTNSGQIQLSSISANLNGGAITNTGLIAGTGNVSNTISNTSGTIQAVGGTLSLSGTLTNTGTLAAIDGAKLLVSGGLSSNSGTIQLTGGTFDNGGNAISNASAGIISGYGTLNSGVLTNSGQINLSGGSGSTTINSPITGLSGSSITVASSIASFYGTVAVQSGATMRVSSGAEAVFFGTVDENTGSIFSGTGTSIYEGTLNTGGSGSVAVVPVTTPAVVGVHGMALTPASSTLTPGVVSNAGNVILGSTSTFVAAIGGTIPGSYDQYQVGGSLTYGGTLQLDWYGGFQAVAGESFRLFEAASESGEFAAVDTSGAQLAPGLVWDTSELATEGVISIAAAPVPLPDALWLMISGLGGLALLRRHPVRLAA